MVGPASEKTYHEKISKSGIGMRTIEQKLEKLISMP
jgi:hypothetical protein